MRESWDCSCWCVACPARRVTDDARRRVGGGRLALGDLPARGHGLGAAGGSRRRRRRRGRMDGAPEHPDWSPDGSRLAVETDFATIWTVAADGSTRDGSTLARGRASLSRTRLVAGWAQIAFVEVQTKDGVTTSRGLLRVVDVADRPVRNDSSPTAPDGSGYTRRAGPTTAARSSSRRTSSRRRGSTRPSSRGCGS